MDKTNPSILPSFIPSIPTTIAPAAMSGPEINKDTLRDAANHDDVAMKELLRGSGEREAQVDRVRLALGVLQSDMAESKKEEKARIARAARELMDEHLPTVKTELQAGANIALSNLQKKIEEARSAAVLEERGTMSNLSFEAVSYDVNEITRELKGGDWKTWAMYAGVAAGAGFAAKWLWDHSIGWLWKKVEGSKEKPGFLRRAAGWLATGAGIAAGAVGFHYWKMNGGKFSATGNAAVDIPTGISNVVGKDILKIAELLQMDAALVYELMASENWEKFWDILSAKGVNVALQHGQVALEFLGDMVVMPAEFGTKLWKRMTTGTWDKDTWLVYGQAGAAYVIGKGTLNAILRGKLSLPLTAKDGILTIVQMGAWPADMAKDVIQAGRTGITAGGRGLMLRYVAPTWPSRLANYGADIVFTPNCSTTQGIESGLQYWKQIEADCDLMDNADWLFDKDVMKITAKRRRKIAKAFQESLKESFIADDAPQYIKDLKKQVDLGLKAFEAEMDKAVLAGKIAPTAEAIDDFAKAAGTTTNALKAGTTGAGVADDTLEAGTDAAKIGKAGANTGNAAPRAGTGVADAADGAPKPPALPGTRPPPLPQRNPLPKAPSSAPALSGAAEQGDEWTRTAAKARQALLAPNATPEAIRAVDDAIMKCKTLGMSADDALKAVADPSVLLTLTKTPANQVTKLAVVLENSGDVAMGMRRLCGFLGSMADNLDDAAKSALLLDKNLLRMVMNSGLDPSNLADMLKNSAVRKALFEGKNIEKLVKDLIWWKNATSLHTMINVGGTVISAAMLVVDVKTLYDRRKELSETIDHLGNDLKNAGFEKDGTDYVHKASKKRISMSVLESGIDNMSNPQWLRVAGSGIGTLGAAGTLAFPAMAVNPLVGLTVLGIEIAVQGAATVWEDDNARQFLLDTPTSVLSILNLNKVIQKDTKDVLDDASSWMWSDYHPNHWFRGDESEEQKDTLRKKAVSIMFFQELHSLAKESPDVAARILRPRGLSDTQDANKSLDAGSFLDEEHGTFWKEDFDAIIKPFLAARLFQMSKDGSVKWNQFRNLKIDEGTFDLENIAPADMRLALREAAHVYAQHLKEKDYHNEKKTYDKLMALPGEEKVLTVHSIETRGHMQMQRTIAEKRLKQMGEESVFGKKVSELDDGTNVTAVQKYLADLTKRLETRADESTTEVQKRHDEIIESLRRKQPYYIPSTNAGPRGDERTLMGKREIFTGANPGAAGNVRLEDVAGVSGRDVERPLRTDEVLAIIASGRDLYTELEGVGTAMQHNSVWYAQPSHFQKLREYSYVVQRQPMLVKEKSVEAFLQKMKHLSEGFSWEDGYFGSSFLAKRNDAFREALAALRTMNRSLDARTYHITMVDRSTIEACQMPVAGRNRTFYWGPDSLRGDPSTLFVECNGTVTEHRPVPGQEYKQMVPGGMVTCTMSKAKGEGKYDYVWSFERGTDAKPGTELYMYFKKDGAEQPGIKFALPEVKTVRKQLNIDRPLVTESIDSINGFTVLTVEYTNADGSPATPLKGTLHDILQSKKISWKRATNTNPKTGEKAEWTLFVPKDGITLVSCQIDHLSKPQSTLYLWKRPSVRTPKSPVQPSKDAELAASRASLQQAITDTAPAPAPAPKEESFSERRARRMAGGGDDTTVSATSL